MIITKRCEICGEEFTYEYKTGGHAKQCKACKYDNRVKIHHDVAPEKPKRKSQVTDIAIEARKLGLSYGQLQARKWLENNRVKV